MINIVNKHGEPSFTIFLLFLIPKSCEGLLRSMHLRDTEFVSFPLREIEAHLKISGSSWSAGYIIRSLTHFLTADVSRIWFSFTTKTIIRKKTTNSPRPTFRVAICSCAKKIYVYDLPSGSLLSYYVFLRGPVPRWLQ